MGYYIEDSFKGKKILTRYFLKVKIGGIMEQKQESKIRYNILIATVYIIGIILLLQLFNLQIINGKSYRESSQIRD